MNIQHIESTSGHTEENSGPPSKYKVDICHHSVDLRCRI